MRTLSDGSASAMRSHEHFDASAMHPSPSLKIPTKGVEGYLEGEDQGPSESHSQNAAPSFFGAGFLDELPPCAHQLRDYQIESITKAAGLLRAGAMRILIQAPTGSGKTHILAAIVAAACLAGLRVLVLATRTRLVSQIHERLDAFGIRHGVTAAALPELSDQQKAVQVASVDTLHGRAIVGQRMPLPAADLIVFDEAHLALADTRVALLGRYPNACHFGLTATPASKAGRSLADKFDHLILGPTVSELVARRMLVKARIFSKPVVTKSELREVSINSASSDYAEGELGELFTQPKLIGDVVENWHRIAPGKRTLVFACNKKHGAALVQEYLRSGVAAELLTANDDEETREAAIARLESGLTLVLVNCFLLSYGIDLPTAECIVLARPTRSVVLYLQSIGRGMRPSPGKESVYVIDHGRVIENLGMPSDDFAWSLDGENVNTRAREALATERRVGEEKPRTCEDCAAVWSVAEEGPACPHCGWKPEPRAKPIPVVPAELHELVALEDTGDRDEFYREACGFYARRWPDRWRENRNKGRGWAWRQTCERFRIAEGAKPPSHYWHCDGLQEPTTAVHGLLMSRIIAYAKRQQSHQRAWVA